MNPVNPVGGSESINPKLPHPPLPRQPAAPAAAAEATAEFHATLLAQHALQLDPDGGQGQQAATPEQLAAALAQLLGLLQERIDDLKERVLLAGGKPAHGLFAELEQVAEVLARLVNLWPRLAQNLPQQLQQAQLRLRPLFVSCHFLLRALQHSAEPGNWRQLADSLATSEQQLLA
ncbi:hypothetical protein [Vogesella sp. LIG4]|uniref:hypothetical protein n=1 Tax=Vogesella sp. LIG4 TaxID=1192162 RepID=UPI00081F79E0|nr:hypothetical protein [Vogesella sp. LIG4]SCK28459.1 hypothetical protein PSELUDRAFT_3484 [Vogesella sp. LIG4]